ncbi:MAG: hypothetical protein Q9208_005941 [Pyrenodesmia sp. 3 TL-2023]
MRLLRLLTSELLSVMSVELEVALNQLHYMLDPLAAPAWKRALGLEFYREIHSDPSLVRELYAQYDQHQERRNIIADHLALFVRLAAENSAVIGLGQHLSQPEVYEDLPAERITVESAGSEPSNEPSLKKTGLSPKWSIARTRCIDQTDKTEPSEFPATYIYALVLTSINSFAEGLAKFLLPFTMPSDLKTKRKSARRTTSSKASQGGSKSDDDGAGSGTKAEDPVIAESPQSEGKLPVNPMTLEIHEQFGQICTAASMVEQCWPALLATSSTFLNASLDSEYLHALIRSFQRFTQVAGLLRLTTPRDAFLTALAKQAVPTLAANPSNESGRGVHEESGADTDRDTSDSERDRSPAPGASIRRQPIVTRNLLCLRALLNLGIALGPVLTDSWTIILETLHRFDVALLAYRTQKTLGEQRGSRGSVDQNNVSGNFDDNDFDTEKKAVETAVARLFQSTSELPEESFLHILSCLSSLAYSVSNLPKPAGDEPGVDASRMPSPQPGTRPRHYRYPSTSGLDLNKGLVAKSSVSLLDRITHVAECNASRLSQVQASSSGWSMLTTLFVDHLGAPAVVAEVRMCAAKKLNNLVIQMLSASKEDNLEHRDRMVSRGIDALATAVSSLGQLEGTKAAGHCSLEIHAMAFEALTLLLEQHGEIMRSGWDTVFYMINSIFVIDEQPLGEHGEGLAEMTVSASRSPRLLRPSFAALQLLCSDFLASIPKICFPTLLDTQYYFASQNQDFNTSLTLSAEAWTMCFRLVFFTLLSSPELKQHASTDDDSWEDTAVLLVQRLSKTFMQSLGTFTGYEKFDSVWNQLLVSYGDVLCRRELGLSRAVFDSLAEVLAAIERTYSTHKMPLDSDWVLWRDNNPATYDLEGNPDNKKALEAHLKYIRQLRGLLDGRSGVTQVEAILTNLRLCIINSTPLTYGSDINEMTTVQTLVLENIGLIPMPSTDIVVQVATELAYLVTLAFQTNPSRIEKGKTFVALARAAMDALRNLVVEQRSVKSDAPLPKLLFITLAALNVPIHLKYKWLHEGKEIATWKKATSTALSLLDEDLLRSFNNGQPDEQSLWTAIVELSDGIAAADTDSCTSTSNIGPDLTFDIESFSQLAGIIIPILGSPSIPDRIRRKYVGSLFEHSLIHEPHPDDLARPDQDLLDGLRSEHVGRVQDLPPKLRSKMAYILLDHLFDLVAVRDGSPERVKLAEAAAPYLVLRAGLVMKAYVCDQPLRGLMPQPQSQKREMHCILKKLVELDSEPKAFPETMGVQSEHKKHLFLLFSLLTKALKAAWRDKEMGAALHAVLEAVGADFES